jgi:cytochrome c553
MASRVLTLRLVGATSAALALALPALVHAEGDPERGRQIAYTCYGCHGIPSYKNVYPTYSVPKLQGQTPEYIVIALQAYRTGERAHATMHSQAATLSDQDMQDIAAFLAGAPLKAGSQPKGEAPAKVTELCVSCHGPDGVGITPQYPSLAGQYADYLERALMDYRDGGRKNPVMGGFTASLSDADIKAVAAYYAEQQPALSPASHAMWFLQANKSENK